MYEEFHTLKNLIIPTFQAIKSFEPKGCTAAQIDKKVAEIMNVPEECVNLPAGGSYGNRSMFKVTTSWARRHLSLFPKEEDGYVLYDEETGLRTINPKYVDIDPNNLPVNDIIKATSSFKKYDWIPFYREFAQALLRYKDHRKELVVKINNACRPYPSIRIVAGKRHFNDFLNTFAPEINDIDPLTIFAYLNYDEYDDSTRIEFCNSLKSEFELKAKCPTNFKGIIKFSKGHNRSFSWYGDDDYDDLIKLSWDFFEAALNYIPNENTATFDDLFNQAVQASNGWSVMLVTKALFYINPDQFFTDIPLVCEYINDKIIPLNITKRSPIVSPNEYLDCVSKLREYLCSDDNKSKIKNFIQIHIEAQRLSESDEEKDDSETEDIRSEEQGEEEISTFRGSNIIYYGIPGCGKSYAIKKEYDIESKSKNNQVERIVFHPDYSYSDFVGQLIPKNESGEIKYEFEPGPFTRILKLANENPNLDYYLLIEEINRGNAPAIFGDIFQLLDRNEECESEYRIVNNDIARHVYGHAEEKIYIPSNLFIIATMNTADQNVFTLDTAFKRRWDMIYIQDSFAEDNELKDLIIGNTGVTWETFHNVINAAISRSNRFLTSEDKRLGVYFCSKEEVSDIEKFTDKVIRYLWDDVSKVNREIFTSSVNSYDDIYAAKEDDPTDFFNKIFSSDIANELVSNEQR